RRSIHINTGKIRKNHSYWSRREINLLNTRIAAHLNNLVTGCTANDRIIHQQYVLAFDFQIDRIEFLTDRFFPLLLTRHDKRTPDVAVFYQTFAEFYTQLLCQSLTRYTAAVRNWNDYIDIVIRTLA